MPPASGTFEVEHWLDASHENGVTFSGKVDCLMVGGRTAAFTGVIDKARLHGNVPPEVITEQDVRDLVGSRQGFSVHDQGRGRMDRMGLSWLPDQEHMSRGVPKCQSIAPVVFVDQGDYKVHEWLPPTLYPHGRR